MPTAQLGYPPFRMALTSEALTSKRPPTGRSTRTGPFVPAPPDDQRAPVERRRVRDIRLSSVARVSVCFYLCGLVVALVAALVLWIVASAVGVVGELESFMDDLGFEGFRFISGTLLWASLLIGLGLTAILVVLTVVAAAIYNLFADLVGGLEVTLAAVDNDAAIAPAERNGNGHGNGNGNGDGVRHR